MEAAEWRGGGEQRGGGGERPELRKRRHGGAPRRGPVGRRSGPAPGLAGRRWEAARGGHVAACDWLGAAARFRPPGTDVSGGGARWIFRVSGRGIRDFRRVPIYRHRGS